MERIFNNYGNKDSLELFVTNLKNGKFNRDLDLSKEELLHIRSLRTNSQIKDIVGAVNPENKCSITGIFFAEHPPENNNIRNYERE